MMVERFTSIERLSEAAAEIILKSSTEAIARKGVFNMALSGGNTPRTLYRMMAGEPFVDAFDWGGTHFFWSDERCVPQDHRFSNFAMANEVFLSKAPVPVENIHPAICSPDSPAIAAASYEKQLRNHFGSPLPVFDLILLGMGKDGHTASLFPGDDSLRESARWVVAVDGSRASPPVPRITFTLPVLNNAERVIFLAWGSEKMAIVEKIINHPGELAGKYPAAMARPKGELLWLIGEPA